MKIDLANKSKISTKRILKLIEFCRPKNLKLPKIIVKNCRDQTKAYDCEFFFDTQNPYIVFRFNDATFYPFEYKMSEAKKEREGYLGNYFFANKTECLIYIFAHELNHAATFLKPSKQCLFYLKSPKIERLADLFALRKLEKYRELKEAGIDPLK